MTDTRALLHRFVAAYGTLTDGEEALSAQGSTACHEELLALLGDARQHLESRADLIEPDTGHMLLVRSQDDRVGIAAPQPFADLQQTVWLLPEQANDMFLHLMERTFGTIQFVSPHNGTACVLDTSERRVLLKLKPLGYPAAVADFRWETTQRLCEVLAKNIMAAGGPRTARPSTPMERVRAEQNRATKNQRKFWWIG